MGRMRKSLSKIGENKFGFIVQEEVNIYKYLVCRKLRKRDIEKLREKGVLFNYYSEWEGSVINAHKSDDEEKLKEFSRHLEQRIRNEQIISQYIALAIPILLTAFLTTVLGMVLELFNQDLSGEPWWVGIMVICAGLFAAMFVGYFFADFFKDMIDYQTREKMFVDYKNVIDKMIQNGHLWDENVKSIENIKKVESFLSVEENKIEIRNICADVDIEIPNYSIHIKQK